ncbi:F-box domain-containing protein [Mycena indigotica]|uniref:F-box domain-containing protein n=1 Tax=Mycena indigotica TaxID=2126181 RepID=A0A8H6S0E4_9AGAR|nr:F-box domain-containing protein [Mycena indigotica]KAF7290644.1 F-box domain-containing protein [Mycena indigotica]
MSTKESRATDRTRIAALNQQIQQLVTEKEALQKRLDAYKYPILTLPNEIMAEIFQHCLPAPPHSPPPFGPGSPTVLTHVCSLWRQIALAMPGLWCSISMDSAPDTLISCWLERSGTKPLSIQTNNMLDSVESSLLHHFRPHQARWETIQLRVDSQSLSTLLLPMPLLRHIELDGQDVPAGTRITEVPALRSAILWEFDQHMVLLPWQQLTSLALISTTPEECTPILQEAIQLIVCELVLTGALPDDQPQITLPALERLTLTHYLFTEEPAPTGFLEFFSAPCLKRLRIVNRLIPPSSLERLLEKHDNIEEICILGKRGHGMPTRQVQYASQHPTIKFTLEENLDEWFEDMEADQTRMAMRRLRSFIEIPLFE